jgi:hypothetical protein
MASAPDVTEVGPVLNNASEMRANCRKRSEISIGRSNQDSWLAAKLKNLPAVGLYIIRLNRQSHSPSG